MFSRLVKYIREAKKELKKVVWPTRKEATHHTLLVIGISLGVAIFLGIVDYILSRVLEIIIK